MFKKKTIIALIAFLLLFGVAIVAVFFVTSKLKTQKVIELNEDGFYPKEVTIREGERVTFLNKTNKPFWPASNLHPTHEIYSDFDSRKAIAPKESWSFTFTMPGEWEYHDHLRSLYVGKIIVLNQKGGVVLPDCADATLGDYRKQKCLGGQFAETIKKDGLSGAFSLLSSLYVSDRDFASQCHSYTHIIGQAAYKEFAQTGKMDLDSGTSYCGYGFYHGFMEAMLFLTGNINGARLLCDYAQNELGGDAKGSCYHGIGHGLVDGNDPNTRGNPDAMVGEALNICERTGENNHFVGRCASGAFNSLAIFWNAPSNASYVPTILKTNPYFFCEKQEKEYFKRACYWEMNTTVLILTDFNFTQSFRYVEQITDDVYAKIAAESMPGFAIKKSEIFTDEKIITICRSIQDRLRLPCILGFAAGFVEFGPPNGEYERPLQFCQSTQLTGDEQKGCLNRIIPYIRLLYSAEKMNQICLNVVADVYKDTYCK
ncbi:MAG TPA: cupredoxin domain-containing protein [Candidatus Paceibacterota bacterium]